MKPSLSAPTLTDFATAIAAEFNRSAGLPEPVQIKCAVNRGKLMVLAQQASSEPLPARQVFAHLEQQVRQQIASVGLPETIAAPEQLPIQLYLKQASQPRPYAAHRFDWQMSSPSAPLIQTESSNPSVEEDDPALALSPEDSELAQPPAVVTDNLNDVELPTDSDDLDTAVLPADVDTAGDSPLTHLDNQDYREPVPIPAIESTVNYPEDADDPETRVLDSQGESMEALLETEALDSAETALPEGPELAGDEPVIAVPAGDELVSDEPDNPEAPDDAMASVEIETPDEKPAAIPPKMGRPTEALPTKHSEEDDVPEEEMIFLPDEVEDDAANRPESVPMWDGTFRAEDLYDRSEVDENVATVGDEEVLTQTPQRREPRSRIWAAGLLGAAVVGTGLYMVTRPCVLGRCDRIPRAESLGDAALVELADNPSPQTVLDMQQQLGEAVDLLRPIPVWSFQRGRAQAALQNYQRQLDDLDSVIAAQQDATAATEASQSPPYPVSHWQTVATQWETAIARLETIPAESPIYEEIVGPKLEEYRENLTTIQGRIDSELAADTSVNQATQSGSLATQQTEIANNLETWETALASWQAAVNQLKQVPKGTLAYGEAQQLLPKYEAELSQVRTRTREERIAEQFYTEASRYASEAREYETQNQWTLAMLNWRDAITQAEGVPEGTARYAETQNLLETYRPALGRAQENLRQAQRYQKAEVDFVKACGNASEWCSFTLSNGKVIVRIAEGYDDLIELSITPPDQRATAAANTNLTARANQLFSDLTNIGKRTQIPIELQDSDGAFIARFKPELNGYVKH